MAPQSPFSAPADPAGFRAPPGAALAEKGEAKGPLPPLYIPAVRRRMTPPRLAAAAARKKLRTASRPTYRRAINCTTYVAAAAPAIAAADDNGPSAAQESSAAVFASARADPAEADDYIPVVDLVGEGAQTSARPIAPCLVATPGVVETVEKVPIPRRSSTIRLRCWGGTGEKNARKDPRCAVSDCAPVSNTSRGKAQGVHDTGRVSPSQGSAHAGIQLPRGRDSAAGAVSKKEVSFSPVRSWRQLQVDSPQMLPTRDTQANGSLDVYNPASACPMSPLVTHAVDQTLGPPRLGSATGLLRLPASFKPYFAWEPTARRNVLLTEVLTLPNPRPDVHRLRLIVDSSDDGGAAAWRAFGLSSPVFVVPNGLPADVTVVHSYAEVKYLDTAAYLLTSPEGKCKGFNLDSPLFVGGEILRAFPAPWHSTDSDGWALAAGARRVLGTCADLNDWSVCHGPEDTADRVWPESRTHPVVEEADFSPVRSVVREAVVPAGLVVPTPWSIRFLGVTSRLPTDGWANPGMVSDIVRLWSEQEWAWLVGESYLYQARYRGRAWVVDQILLTFMQDQVARFPGALIVPTGEQPCPWEGILELMRRSRVAEHNAKRVCRTSYQSHEYSYFVGWDIIRGFHLDRRQRTKEEQRAERSALPRSHKEAVAQAAERASRDKARRRDETRLRYEACRRAVTKKRTFLEPVVCPPDRGGTSSRSAPAAVGRVHSTSITAADLVEIPDLVAALGGGYDVAQRGGRVGDVFADLSQLIVDLRAQREARADAWMSIHKTMGTLQSRVEELSAERTQLQATLARVRQEREALRASVLRPAARNAPPPRSFTLLPASAYGACSVHPASYAQDHPQLRSAAPVTSTVRFCGPTPPSTAIPSDPYASGGGTVPSRAAPQDAPVAPSAVAGGGGYGRGTAPADPYASHSRARPSGSDYTALFTRRIAK